MEKLNKVIAGLECCGEDDRCLSCPYKDVGHPNDLDCLKMLAKDALEKLRWMDTMKGARLELARRCRELEEENERLRRKLKYARAERDAATARMARLIGEAEARWLAEKLELRTCYCPICDKHFKVRSNDSGGSCPDCGHHVVLHRLEEAE